MLKGGGCSYLCSCFHGRTSFEQEFDDLHLLFLTSHVERGEPILRTEGETINASLATPFRA